MVCINYEPLFNIGMFVLLQYPLHMKVGHKMSLSIAVKCIILSR